MPLAERPLIPLVAVMYLLGVVVIGLWERRRTRSTADFFVAGRRPGLVVIALATMATAFSGFVFLGGPGLTYRLGLGAFFIFLSVGYTPALLTRVAGRPLRALAEQGEIYTLSDALAARFESRRLGSAVAVPVLLGSVAYVGTQLKALGVLLASVLGWESGGTLGPTAAALLGLAVVLLYSVGGGMLGGLYADVFQGLLMMIAAVAVFVHAIAAAGGPATAAAAIAMDGRFGASFLEPLGRIPAATAFGWLLVFGVGVLGQPQMLHKFFMIREPRQLARMPFALGAAQGVCLLVWIGLGVAVPALVAQGHLAPLGTPDDAAPAYLLAVAPDWLAGLVLAGALAAIMSTANSFLVLAAGALVRDLPRGLGRTGASSLAAPRLATVGVALAAALLAERWNDLIALLGSFSFGLLAASLAPVVALGLHWRRVGARAAEASIWTGLVVDLGLEAANRLPAFPSGILSAGIPAPAVALLASFAVLLTLAAAGTDRARSGRAWDLGPGARLR